MPFTLLLAIFLAFGLDIRADHGPISPVGLRDRLLEALGGVALVGAAAFLLGHAIALRVDRRGGPTGSIRRSYAWIGRLIDALNLGVYAWIIHGADWRGVVERGFGLRDAVVVDEFLILLPYLAGQFLAWWGVYPAERALRLGRRGVGLGRYLILRARQALGLVLPVAFVFALGQDLIDRRWPEAVESPWAQMAWMAAMSTLVLVLAPAFVRLTWPTRPLPSGPLRDRLERLSARFHFRCTDILIWDTGQVLVNAGVTGALPWFRYVLLTDALVDQLDAHQVEAVFGHEVGHVAHRHLSYFGLFFLGSVGVLALAEKAIEGLLDWSSVILTTSGLTGADEVTVHLTFQAAGIVACLGSYFLLVFGFLSRRFERQADVFGCRAVSCGLPLCPPHADLNALPGSAAGSPDLCPVGIRIFAGALSEVASLNGMDRESFWAWRHGSIGRRIAFLESLEGRPEVERRFQRGVLRLRVGLVMVLASAMLLAAYTEALGPLR